MPSLALFEAAIRIVNASDRAYHHVSKSVQKKIWESKTIYINLHVKDRLKWNSYRLLSFITPYRQHQNTYCTRATNALYTIKQEMLKRDMKWSSTILKDCCGDVSKLDNYRAITISCVISKVFELCICDKFGEFLYSLAIHCNLASRIGCQNTIFAMQQTVKYFTERV